MRALAGIALYWLAAFALLLFVAMPVDLVILLLVLVPIELLVVATWEAWRKPAPPAGSDAADPPPVRTPMAE